MISKLVSGLALGLFAVPMTAQAALAAPQTVPLGNVTPSQVVTTWMSVNQGLVEAAQLATRDPSFAARVDGLRALSYSAKKPGEVLARTVEFRDKLDVLRAKMGLDPTSVYVDPSGAAVTPPVVFLNGAHVQDSFLGWVVALSGDPTHLVGQFYVVADVSGMTPSDAYGLVDLAVRRLDMLIARIS
jgi:hypothetical protein